MFFRCLLLIVAATALPALAVYTYQRHAPIIESAVLEPAQALVDAQPDHALTIEAEGRDLYVSGSMPATGALQRLITDLKDVDGVRRVNTIAVRLEDTDKTTESDTGFSSRISADARGIVISGDAPSRAARARALALTGSDNELAINPLGDEAWTDLVVLITRYRRQFDSLDMTYRDSVATIRGTTTNRDALSELKIDLSKVLTTRMNIIEKLELLDSGA